VSIKGCPLACSSFHSTRNDPTDSCYFSFRSTRRPAGGCTGSLTVVAPLVPGITSDVTSTRDELADRGAFNAEARRGH